MPDANRDYYTVQEVADRLDISIRGVQKMLERGVFPGAYKIDPDSKRSHWRIPKSDFENHLRKQGKQIQGA